MTICLSSTAQGDQILSCVRVCVCVCVCVNFKREPTNIVKKNNSWEKQISNAKKFLRKIFQNSRFFPLETGLHVPTGPSTEQRGLFGECYPPLSVTLFSCLYKRKQKMILFSET